MNRSHSVPASLALFVLAACSTEPGDQKPTYEPQQEKVYLEQKREHENTLAKQQAYEKALLDLDLLMGKYVQAVWGIGNDRADRQASLLEDAARKIAQEHFPQLVRTAIEADQGQNRAIAVAALGFTGHAEALDPLLNALRDSTPQVVGNAAFALGVLREGHTPITTLAGLVTAPGTTDEVRRTAAWSLVRLQTVLLDKTGLVTEWKRILATPVDKLDAGVAVQALRGLGLLRDPALVSSAAPFASHPVPKVREATAIALGMLNNVDAAETLYMLIGTAEANENVKLAARKALMALAGNVDLGWDVNEWRKAMKRER